MTLHKIDGEKFYTIDTAFDANADKGFKRVKAEKDGQSCTVTVELDGKAPGLPTGATHTRRVPGHCMPAVLITREGNRLPYYYKPCAVKVA